MAQALIVAMLLAATMPAVGMKVVDEHGAPLEGVHAMFQANAREGTLTGHGGRSAVLFVTEAVSDASGELRLPSQEFSPRPFFLNTNFENPRMVLFKPGFAPVVLHNERRIVPELQDMTRWEHDGRTIAMKKAADAERAKALFWTSTYATQATGPCNWKKVPRFLVALEREAAQLNPKPAGSTPLQTVLRNEAFFADQGCGSAKAFFEPYLRTK